MRRAATAALLFCAAAAAPALTIPPREGPPPQGLDLFLSAGPVLTFGSHLGRSSHGGFGLEASVVLWPAGFDLAADKPWAVGLVAQAQSVGWFDHARWQLSAELLYRLVGIELGAAVETAAGDRSRTASFHVQPFFSLGPMYIGVRVSVPVDAPANGWPAQLGVVLGVKVPFQIVKSQPPARAPLTRLEADNLHAPCAAPHDCRGRARCTPFHDIAGRVQRSCEMACKSDDDCPEGLRCARVADGPDLTCRARQAAGSN